MRKTRGCLPGSRNPGLSFGAGEERGAPTTPCPHIPRTPSPALLTAWVAGASRGLPGGSPVMTLITQVSGSSGGGESPRGCVHMAPGQPTPGPSSSFMSLVPRAGGQAGEKSWRGASWSLEKGRNTGAFGCQGLVWRQGVLGWRGVCVCACTYVQVCLGPQGVCVSTQVFFQPIRVEVRGSMQVRHWLPPEWAQHLQHPFHLFT